ncbi:MAG: VWA domain-containing protein [Deltaproteobacteria bacterium]|nr:VWA domain-containing protein [Deltaproteobacteria bacterium]MBW2416939.1 VWA domain-containing protein [Deltaproteobacteria bacterium]
MGLELRDPLFLLAGLLAPLAWWLVQRGSGRLTYSSLALVEAAPRSLRARLAALPALLLALAVLLFAVALAGPRSGDATTEIHREGIAIAMVVDHSGSMEARDFVQGNTGVSRLDAVKAVMRKFVLGEEELSGRPDDLIGVVLFARYADAICPLTLDHLNLANILDQIEIVRDRAEDGTAVGEGLALAVERLRRHPAKSKVVILLTDGVSNAGEIDPLQAATLAAAHDIRVYAVGAGRTGTAPIPVALPDGRRVLRRVRVELDEKTLQKIASRTGGRYFHAANVDALEEVYEEIDRLERSEITELRYLQYTEHYAAWVGAGLVAVVFSALLGGTVLRRFP